MCIRDSITVKTDGAVSASGIEAAVLAVGINFIGNCRNGIMHSVNFTVSDVALKVCNFPGVSVSHC